MLLVAALVLGVAGVAFGAASAQRGLTRDQGDAILKELKQIRELLEKQQASVKTAPAAPAQPAAAAAPVRVRIGTGHGHVLGRADAPVTIIEFSDYQCPYSKRFYTTIFSDLKKDYIDTGKVRFVSRDLPLAFHQNAQIAARAARCAGAQGYYWEMRDLLMRGTDLSEKSLVEMARGLKLDVAGLQACLKDEGQAADIQQDLKDAGGVGITGTPTFVIGRTVKDGPMKDGPMEGLKVVGAQPYANFEAKIKELLPKELLPADAPPGNQERPQAPPAPRPGPPIPGRPAFRLDHP
jgi:protein-disulfide isomerase